MPRDGTGLRRGARMAGLISSIGAAAATALLGAAMLAPAAAQSVPTIRVGWTVPAEEAKWLIMKRPELFPDSGKHYKIEWFQFQGTPPMSQALVAKAVDCATQAPISFAKAVGEGALQGYILGSLAQEKKGFFAVLWAVPEDSPIKTIADLKGKTVATTVFGGGIHALMMVLLERNFVDPQKDVTMREVGFPLVEDALRAGRVDAGPFAQPFWARAKEKGGLRVLFELSDVQSPLTETFEACRKDFVDANPDAVRAYMADFKRGTKYAIAHPEEARQVTSEVTKIDLPTLEKYLMTERDFYRDPTGTPDFAAIQKTWDLFYEKQLIAKPLAVTDYQRLDVTPQPD
jgi:ABC-type nitrate/sulfonate/bicarbonate transport system substrate-binding protein